MDIMDNNDNDGGKVATAVIKVAAVQCKFDSGKKFMNPDQL